MSNEWRFPGRTGRFKSGLVLIKNKLTTESATMIGQICKLEDLEEKQYIVSRLALQAGSLATICGTGESGKSFLLQYLAACVASGKPLFGVFPVKQGPVVHIDQEQSKSQTMERYIRIANNLGINYLDVKRVRLCTTLDAEGLNFEDVKEEMIELCSGAKLVIIDSLSKLLSVDENSSQAGAIVNLLKLIADETNCCIVCLHHKGKGKDAKQSGRGHSSIFDNVDVQIDLQYNMKANVFSLWCQKNRNGKHFHGMEFELLDKGMFIKKQDCSREICFNLLKEEIPLIQDERRSLIHATLIENGSMNNEQLFSLVKGDRKVFNLLIKSMLDNNEITETRGRKNAKMYSTVDVDDIDD